MPDGLELVRTTPEFTEVTMPAGLRRAHQVAAGVWGRLRVMSGEVRFVFECEAGAVQTLVAGQSVDIPPGSAHRVEPGRNCRFVVEFHAPPVA
jgi:tellurite resistance-related uncharacterized protein